MIDKVILYDIKCGKNYISTLEARQILGRAGRTYNKFEQGQTYIFGKQQQLDKINQYYYGDDNTVNSNLTNIDMIAFHILPDIQTNKVKNIQDIKKWYQDTLAFVQGNIIDENELYNYLKVNNCIDQDFNVLQNGELSIQFYYTPKRISVLIQKLNYLIQQNDFSLMALAWLFSYYSGNKVFHPLYQQFQQERSNKYYLKHNELFDFFFYYLILNGRSIKKIGSYIVKTRKDIFRLFAVLKKIVKSNQDMPNINLKLIENMIYYNVNKEQSQLMEKLNCYDKNLIQKLNYFNIQSVQDIDFKLDYIQNFFDRKTFQKCLTLIKEQKNDRQTN